MANIIHFDGTTYTSLVSPEGGSVRFRLALLAIIGLGAMVCVLAAVVVWALLR